jgi:Flp pilus assembly protein TadG
MRVIDGDDQPVKRSLRGDDGQTVVETALILSVLMLLTGGLIDVGRAFYAYNTVSNAARFGARFGTVVGGSCMLENAGGNDFCDQLNSANPANWYFWGETGNVPLQTDGNGNNWNVFCDTYANAPSHYYTASSYKTSKATTIVGAVVQRFDTTNSAASTILGDATPGFDLSRLHVCIDGSANTANTPAATSPTVFGPQAGDWVGVTVTYQFKPAGPLFGNFTLNLSASSEYTVE